MGNHQPRFDIRTLSLIALFLWFWSFFVSGVHAQEVDNTWPGHQNLVRARTENAPLVVSGQMSAAVGTTEELPLWIHANRWGILDYDSPQGLVVAGAAGYYEPWDSGFGRHLALEYQLIGVYGATREDYERLELNTGYGRVELGPLELAAGAYPLERGSHHGPLSSGSVLLSRNARPIPRIHLGLHEYVDVPLTDGVFQIRGSLGHGWLEEDRYIESPWLHEKDMYLRVNDPFGWGLSVYRGLAQEVVWGGTNPDGSKRPSTWYDFWKVFRSAGTGSESVRDENPESRARDLSDTLGMWEMGIQLQRPSFSVLLHHQHFFEVGSGYQVLIFGNSNELTTPERIRDGLWSVHLEVPRLPYLDSFLYEYFNTTDQNELTAPGNLTDHFYEHWIYRSGWAYRGRSVGPALVTLEGSGKDTEFIHTRIEAHHLGIQGTIAENVDWRLIGTYGRSFGTSRRNYNAPGAPDEIYDQGLTQTSFLGELSMTHDLLNVPNLFGSIGLGLDHGELRGDSAAVLVTVGWRQVVP